jgi:hypothetical protein
MDNYIILKPVSVDCTISVISGGTSGFGLDCS